ncbi:MAG TPA: class I SAM-dependent methyltransferase, partial [Acidobacteriaceae bacterium]
MTAARAIATFRDPSGSLTLQDDYAVRRIHPFARLSTLELIQSAFYRRMLGRGDVVATAVEADDANGLLLQHPLVPVPTYPWEWTPSQWLAAAELTLNLCEEALAEGWIMKDATPLNILFIGAHPVLVDVLSFERLDPASSLWLAQGQYIRTFLLPLLMQRLCGWPLALSLFHRDGYEPAEIYRSLSWRKRLSRTALWPITLPAWLEGRKPSAAQTSSWNSDPELNLSILKRMLKRLRTRTRRAITATATSSWSAYQESRSHYTAEQNGQKQQWVRQVLRELQPARVLDIGANTGEFSAMAAAMGIHVTALERDAASAENIFRMSHEQQLPIQTIQADIARPTPPAGWDNGESSALLERLEDRFELVLMLAVVHHLLLTDQIPLREIIA